MTFCVCDGIANIKILCDNNLEINMIKAHNILDDLTIIKTSYGYTIPELHNFNN